MWDGRCAGWREADVRLVDAAWEGCGGVDDGECGVCGGKEIVKRDVTDVSTDALLLATVFARGNLGWIIYMRRHGNERAGAVDGGKAEM